MSDYNSDGIADLLIFKPYFGPYFYTGKPDSTFEVNNDALASFFHGDSNRVLYDTNNDGYFDFGFLGLTGLDYNYDGKTDLISGTYTAKRTKGGRLTPILINANGQFHFHKADWWDDISDNTIMRSPSTADINRNGLLELSRSGILYTEQGDSFTTQVYQPSDRKTSFIAIDFLSENGFRTMHGRSLLVEGASFKKRVFVDVNSGFLNNHQYTIIEYLPDGEKTVKVSYTDQGDEFSFNVSSGQIATIRSSKSVSVSSYK